MIRRYIIEADDSLKGFDEAIEKLEREWGAEEIEGSEDCVSREAVYRQINKWVASGDSVLSLHNRVNALPSVQPQPKRGNWEDCSNGWMCSNCYRDVTYESDFCPNCGVDMREVNQSD